MSVEFLRIKAWLYIITDDPVISFVLLRLLCCESLSFARLKLDHGNPVTKFRNRKKMKFQELIDRAGVFHQIKVKFFPFFIFYGISVLILCIIFRDERKPFFIQILVDDPDEVLCRNIKGRSVKRNVGFAVCILDQTGFVDVADESDDQSQKDDGIDYDVGDMLAGQFFRIHDWLPLLLQCVLTRFENANIQKIVCMGSVSWRQISVKSGYKASGGGDGFRGGQYRILSREKEVDIIFAKSSFLGKFNVRRESELCSGKDYII